MSAHKINMTIFKIFTIKKFNNDSNINKKNKNKINMLYDY